MTKLAITTLCVLTSSQLWAEPELRGTAPELTRLLTSVPKTVDIIGEAEVKVAADKALVTLKVSTENKSLQEALRANQELRTKLTSHLKQQGIAPERVQSSRFSSTPKFTWYKEKAKSYRVDNLVKVTVQDEKEFQSAASAVDTWPEVQFVGAEFEHQDKEALKAKAVAQACDNADQRRKVYEEKLGLKLVPARFSGGSVSQKPPPGLAAYYGGGIYTEKPSRTVVGDVQLAGLPAAAQQEQEMVSSFGELVYVVQVTIEYTVQPK